MSYSLSQQHFNRIIYMFSALKTFFRIYAEGLRGMTWGKTLWIIALIKLFVMFAVLKLFFFQPTLKGSAQEKATTVGDNFVQEQQK